MKIGEVCRKTGVSRRNIHFYIQEGLIHPSSDSSNHYFNFSEEDCATLEFVHNMRNAGLSILAISSMLSYPVTAGYYLNQQIKMLKRDQRHIEQTLISLQYILDDLPFYPELSSLMNIVSESGIPQSVSKEPITEFDRFSTAMINRFLWGGFLPENELTEYQEFLWMKINRITAENPSEDYLQLRKTLYTIKPQNVNELFAAKNDRYRLISSVSDQTLPDMVKDMIMQIERICRNPSYVAFWKKSYSTFYAPTARIQASPISSLVMELSPLYKDYVININRICSEVYSFLHSEPGASLLGCLKNTFRDKLDIETSNHGELEALISIPVLFEMMK